MSLSVTISSITQTSCTATVKKVGTVPIRYEWYLDGSWYADGEASASQTSASCIFMSLSPSTTYRISVRAYRSGTSEELDNGSTTVTTKSSDSGDSGGGDSGGGILRSVQVIFIGAAMSPRVKP